MKRTPEEKLLNPRPGSKIAAARDFGIDLTLLVENLRRTPTERLMRNEQAVDSVRQLHAAMQASNRKGAGKTS